MIIPTDQYWFLVKVAISSKFGSKRWFISYSWVTVFILKLDRSECIILYDNVIPKTGYAGLRDYVENLKSPCRTPHWSPHPTQKDDPDPVVADSDPIVANSVHRTPAREGWSLPRQGRDHLLQWDVEISVGFFTETTGSIRNPETRRTPSIILIYVTCIRLKNWLDQTNHNLQSNINKNQYYYKWALAVFTSNSNDGETADTGSGSHNSITLKIK